MCSRNSMGFVPEKLSQRYDLSSSPGFEPSWNVAPSEETPVVLPGDQGMTGELGVWSYVPWFGDRDEWMQKQVINARIESVESNAAFREAWKNRRCIIPSTGFYEWKGKRGSKVPVFFHRNGDIFSMAGIYTQIETSQGVKPAYAVLTRSAQSPISKIHDREPVMLRRNQIEKYLNAETKVEDIEEDRGIDLETQMASKEANNPQNKSEAVISGDISQLSRFR